MATKTRLLDTVAVVRDLPEFGLTAGEVGAVVEELPKGAFEVEFCDAAGQAYALHPLNADQVVSLHMRGEAVRFRPDDSSLVDNLLQSNRPFQELVDKSKPTPRQPFVPRSEAE